MLSATDIANFLSCHHLSTLEGAEARGEIQKPFFHDPGVELFRELGIRHEAQYLLHLINTEGFKLNTSLQISHGAQRLRLEVRPYRGLLRPTSRKSTRDDL